MAFVVRKRRHFGRPITRRYHGKLQTVLDRRNEGQPILRSSYRSSFVKQYEKGARPLRTETCLNDTHNLGIGRGLEHLPVLTERRPLVTLAVDGHPRRPSPHPSEVEAPFRQIDAALDHLCATLCLKAA